MEQGENSRMPPAKRLLFSPIALALFLLLGEIVGRVVLYQSPIEPCPRRASGDAVLLGDLKPDQDQVSLMDRRLPFRELTNSQGLRRDGDVALTKPAGVYRVLCLGDSFTYGPYVSNDNTYPAQLEQRTNQALGCDDVKIEVLNAGMCGYTICDEHSLLKYRGLRAEPDLVILQVLANDLYGMYDFMRQGFCRGGEFCARPLRRERSDRLACANRRMLAESGLYRGLYELMQAAKGVLRERRLADARLQMDQRGADHMPRYYDGELPERAQHERRYAEIFAEFVRLCREHNVDLLVLLPGKTNERGVREYFAALCARHGVEFVDTTAAFGAYPMDETYLFPINGHLSRLGNILLAKQLEPLLQQRALRPLPQN